MAIEVFTFNPAIPGVPKRAGEIPSTHGSLTHLGRERAMIEGQAVRELIAILATEYGAYAEAPFGLSWEGEMFHN
jgi:hypothetical protein